MKRHLTIGGVIILMVFMFSWMRASAYSINAGATSSNPVPTSNGTSSFDNLWLPFANFFQSINAVGTSAVHVAPTQSTQNNGDNGQIEDAVKNGFNQFDAWLYGVAGFHISGFFTAVLNIFSWLLGVVKGGVDWVIKALS